MEKFLNLVRSNNMVQAVLCIAFGLFLMIYPSITVQLSLIHISLSWIRISRLRHRRQISGFLSSPELMARCTCR